MRNRIIPALIAGLLLAACGDDTSTGGNGGESQGGSDTGGNDTGGTNVGAGSEGGQGGDGGAPVEDVCGDGAIQGTEACDDGDVAAGDGCNGSCAVEEGFLCNGEPSTCATVCGDSVVAGTEGCDDGNTDEDDGCSSTCAIEAGWECDTAEPSVCTAECGDGVIAAGAEACDDANVDADDGCDATCAVEAGWSCDMEPSVCTTGCGDGVIAGMEACDDGNMVDEDGCSAACVVDAGYDCTGEPSDCTLAGFDCTAPIVATDGFVFTATGIEQYGDDYDFGNDEMLQTGCFDVESTTPNTSPELVFSIDLAAGQRLNVRNFGTLDVVWQVVDTCAVEACLGNYDGNPGSSEQTTGLSFVAPAAGTYFIMLESYYGPSSTNFLPNGTMDIRFEVASCGDGIAEFGEGCDDSNTTAADGCSDTCTVEAGYECTGSPSVCTATCGNGTLDTGETCDDANTTAADGCSATCTTEAGYTCGGTPSVCTPIPAASCADPIVVTSNAFQYTGTAIGVFGNDENHNPGTGCVDPLSSGGSEIVFRVDAVAGETIRVRELNASFDAVMHILTQPSCAGGSACSDSIDGGSTTEIAGIDYVAPADGPVFIVVESYGSGDNTDPFDIRIDTNLCGNGAIEGAELCDDGDTTASDGCSATCTVESLYACTGQPSVCVSTCGNGALDTGEACDDGNTAAADGCSASCVVEASFVCSGVPSTCVDTPPNATCADPIVVTGAGLRLTGNDLPSFVDNESYNAGATCIDASTTPPNGYDMVFRVDMVAGQTVTAREMNDSLDLLIHILDPGMCGAGTACEESIDFGESTGASYTAAAAESVYIVVESYGNPSATTAFDVRIELTP